MLACDVMLANKSKFKEQGTMSNAHAVFVFTLYDIYAFGRDVVKGPLAGLGEQMYTQE